MRIHEIGENRYIVEIMYEGPVSESFAAASDDTAFENVEAVADKVKWKYPRKMKSIA